MNLQNTTLDDIAGVIGFAATLRLAAFFGDTGGKMYVPIAIASDQELVRLIGEKLAQKLTNEWPGELLAVPRAHQYELDLRRKYVRVMTEQGFSTVEIAGHLGMDKRRVQQISKELDERGLLRKTPPKNGRRNAPQEKPVVVVVTPWPFVGKRKRRRAVQMVMPPPPPAGAAR